MIFFLHFIQCAFDTNVKVLNAQADRRAGIHEWQW